VPTFAPTRPLTPGPWCRSAELSAWTPPQDLRPSQFAEQFRVLTRRQSSRPGPWRNDNAPPLAVIMDLCVRRTVRELWIRKAAQLGVSEAIRNVIMYIAVREPDPLLLVLPNEQVGRKIVRKRLIPLFEDTECLAELATESARDKKLTGDHARQRLRPAARLVRIRRRPRVRPVPVRRPRRGRQVRASPASRPRPSTSPASAPAPTPARA
jgi:hypothetical protein